MAVRTNNNKTYYINPSYLTFVEDTGYGANLIQVSASSSCYIFVYDPSYGIEYSDADRNYRKWKVTAYNNRFPDIHAYNIYVRLEREGTSALVVYSRNLLSVAGGIITITYDEEGNEVRTEGDPDPKYYYIKIGEVSATDGYKIRSIAYDTGYLTSDQGRNEDSSGLGEMFELDRLSTPWVIKVKQWFQDLTIKNPLTLLSGLLFKKDDIVKPVTDIKRSIDEDEDVPVSDENLATSKYVEKMVGEVDDRYLKKYEPDETEHRIKFHDGIEAGNYVKGMIGGSGAIIDGEGYGEMTGLTLREFLEVPELRFNRVDVVSGELWNSIAFGLIESVDTERMICTLKLEGNERAGLELNDICRGIFADFGEDELWEGEDECGFQHLYGFRTSYFTPVVILENKEGVFRFRYTLRSGTTQHPVASMKFAVYGNFTDPSRQASAYSTRRYKRYLNKVDTWVIDPTKNIYAQYGDLEGLTIGSMTMHGYGTYQHNCYFTGTYIQFTKEQMDDLKGQDAYTAVLSDYEGIVTIDDEGNVVGGDREVLNVINEGNNVIAGDENVVTSGYMLCTTVQAMRGGTPLFYSPVMAEDAYILSISPVGCDAVVVNGAIMVTSVTDTSSCYVNISVSCEGNATFLLTYHVTAVREGRNPIVADLDNEMDSVACDSEGNVVLGLPVSTNVSMWSGIKQLVLDRIELTSVPEGVTVLVETNENGKPTGKVTVPEGGITKDAGNVLPIRMMLYATNGSMQYHKELVFTVNKVVAGENAVIYKLLPDVTSVKVDDAGVMTARGIGCRVTATDGKGIRTLDSLEGTDISLQYHKDKNTPADYAYGTTVDIDSGVKTVTFTMIRNQEVADRETIPVISDGSSPMVVDLDNEMHSIPCDENGFVIAGLPVSTGVHAYYGGTELDITDITVGDVPGVEILKEGTTVTVVSISNDSADNIRIPITVTAHHGTDYTRTVYFLINKIRQGESSVVLSLLPSVSSVYIDGKGEYSTEVISCKVKRTQGKNGADVPDSIASMGYSMGYALDGAAEQSYTYGSGIMLYDGKGVAVKSTVEFFLYYNDNDNRTLVDHETIRILKDGSSPVAIDFDNEMVSVACDENGDVVGGLPVSSVVRMYYGSDLMDITAVSQTPSAGVTASSSILNDRSGAVVEVTDITKDAPDFSTVTLVLTGAYGAGRYTKSASLKINKLRQGESAAIVDLLPSASSIGVDLAGSYDVSQVSCKVRVTTGKTDVTIPDSLPSGYSMKYTLDGQDKGTYTYGSLVDVTGSNLSLGFSLIYDGKVVDEETVRVLKDGKGAFKSTVFYRSNETPDTPTGGSYISPEPTSQPQWHDGIPEGEEILWASTRVFHSDESLNIMTAWSKPTQMTDTASFDVEYSSVDDSPGNPTSHPDNWNDTASAFSVWMATRNKRNGVCGNWQVSKIKGEDGSSGDSSFKSTVFYRSNSTPGTPTGGSYESPKPTSSPKWSDGIPSGEKILWASTRIFTKSGGSPQQSEWSEPRQMTDTSSFDVEFSSVENPSEPSGHPNTNTQWSDTSGENTIWMATSVKINGEWSAWQVSKVKGEKGEDGDNAYKSTVFFRSNETPDAPTGGSYASPKPTSSPEWSDGIPSGEEILWASTRIFTKSGASPQQTTWSEPRQMTDTASFDVEFSSVPSPNPPSGHPNTNTQWSGTADENTIWMATSTKINGEWNAWQVSKIKGEKGDKLSFGDLTDEDKDSLKGEDAQYYTIEAAVASIGYTVTGGYSPSSFIVSEYHIKGASKLASNRNYIHIYGIKDDQSSHLEWTDNVNQYVFEASKYQSRDFDTFLFELREGSGIDSALIQSTSVSVGREGQRGAAGVQPRYRGLFVPNNPEPYVYDSNYRDIVVYNKQVYQVYAYGSSVTVAPNESKMSADGANDGKWEMAGKNSFLAMDTALVDNANIAGFTFTREGYDDKGAPVGSIRSQSVNQTVTYSHNGAWKNDGVYRKSPSVGNGGFTVETVTFTATDECTVMIEMVASSEVGMDRGYIGALNRNYVQTTSSGSTTLDVTISINNLLSVSGTQSSMAMIPVKKGTYTVQIIYSKDSSSSGNEDCVRYRFIGSPKLYLSAQTGALLCTDVNLTGVINATGGKIGGWTIDTDSLTVSGTVPDTLWISDYTNMIDTTGLHINVADSAITADVGVNKQVFNAAGDSFLATVSLINSQAAGSRRSYDMCGVYVSGNFRDIGVFVQGAGVYISPDAGAASIVKGLAVDAASWSGILPTNRDFVRMTGDVTLPAPSEVPGKIYFIKCNSSYTLSVHKCVDTNDAWSNSGSTLTWKDNRTRMFISDGTVWNEFYTTKD